MVELLLRRVAAVIARKTGSLWETTYRKPPDRQGFWNYFTGPMQETGRMIATGDASAVGS